MTKKWEVIAGINPSMYGPKKKIVNKIILGFDLEYKTTQYDTTFIFFTINANRENEVSKKAEEKLDFICNLLTAATRRPYIYNILRFYPINMSKKIRKEFNKPVKKMSIPYSLPSYPTTLSKKEINSIEKYVVFIKKNKKKKRILKAFSFFNAGAHSNFSEHAFLSFWNALLYLLGDVGKKNRTETNVIQAFWLFYDKGIITSGKREELNKKFDEFYHLRSQVFFGGYTPTNKEINELYDYCKNILEISIEYYSK